MALRMALLCQGRRFSSSVRNGPVPLRCVLGIETSCDDTGVAVVREDGEILAQTVVGQDEVHRKHGGIVPDLAAKETTEPPHYARVRRPPDPYTRVAPLPQAHAASLEAAIDAVLQEARPSLPPEGLCAVAVTSGPGLAPCLKVGLQGPHRAPRPIPRKKLNPIPPSPQAPSTTRGVSGRLWCASTTWKRMP